MMLLNQEDKEAQHEEENEVRNVQESLEQILQHEENEQVFGPHNRVIVIMQELGPPYATLYLILDVNKG